MTIFNIQHIMQYIPTYNKNILGGILSLSLSFPLSLQSLGRGFCWTRKRKREREKEIMTKKQELEICNELVSRVVGHFSNTHPTSHNRVIGNSLLECLMILLLIMRHAKKKESENSILMWIWCPPLKHKKHYTLHV